MRRRSRAGGKPIKARRRKAATLSRPSAPKVSGRRKPSSTSTNTKIALLERDEALEREKATAEILRVISSSPGELHPVFDAILANAVRLCDASYGALWLREGADWRDAAFHGGLPEAYTGQWRTGITRANANTPMDRVELCRPGRHCHRKHAAA